MFIFVDAFPFYSVILFIIACYFYIVSRQEEETRFTRSKKPFYHYSQFIKNNKIVNKPMVLESLFHKVIFTETVLFTQTYLPLLAKS